MSYTLNKTDGTIVAVVPDGQIDNLSTDLTLIGRNYSGFGEVLNENLIKLLEHFANETRPDNPIVGQLWFDTSELKLKVYNGLTFTPVNSASVSDYQPAAINVGDLWFDDINKQLFFYNGQGLVLVGPQYSNSQDKSGVEVVTVVDSRRVSHVITKVFNNNMLIGFYSTTEFIPATPIDGFSDDANQRVVYPGFNVSETSVYKFHGTATNSDSLGGVVAGNYARRDTDNLFNGQLAVASNTGIAVGSGLQGILEVDVGNLILANTSPDKNIQIKVRKGAESENAIHIKSSAREIALYDGKIDSIVTVGGSLRVAGNFTVEGELTSVNTANLVIEDKLIELAKTDSPSDTLASGGGITLKGTTDHSIVWSETSRAWNSTEHVNLQSSESVPAPEFKINGVTVLSSTSLGTGITSIPGVTRFGTQTEITVGPVLTDGSSPTPYLRLVNNQISTLQENQDLVVDINGRGNLVFSNPSKIIGLETTNQNLVYHQEETISKLSAEDLSQAVNKKYLLNSVRTRPIIFSIDVSDGISNSEIAEILTELAPPGEYEPGTIARLLCTSVSNLGVTVNLQQLLDKNRSFPYNTPTGVDYPLTDVNISPLGIPGQPVMLNRTVKTFELVASNWTFVS